MKPNNNIFLYLIPAFIWGSTWYVIKFQLGVVDSLLSVSYRFLLGATFLFLYVLIKRLNLKFSFADHLRIILQGVILFGFNYWFVYQAEHFLTSGLVAITFSTLVFMNIFFSALFLQTKVKKNVVIGAILGVSGTILMFYQEVIQSGFNEDIKEGLLLCILGVLLASLGNIVSAYNQKKGIPVIQANTLGMLYGGLVMFLIAFFMGKEILIDTSSTYILSLFYLAIFGSVIAFTTYLTLIGKIGADKAGYVIVTLPVIALTISYFFEGYQISLFSMLGMLLITSGNLIVIQKKK